jgi:hypothetical protein
MESILFSFAFVYASIKNKPRKPEGLETEWGIPASGLRY